MLKKGGKSSEIPLVLEKRSIKYCKQTRSRGLKVVCIKIELKTKGLHRLTVQIRNLIDAIGVEMNQSVMK